MTVLSILSLRDDEIIFTSKQDNKRPHGSFFGIRHEMVLIPVMAEGRLTADWLPELRADRHGRRDAISDLLALPLRHDRSFNLVPEIVYTGFTNWEVRLRASVNIGAPDSEYGEKQADSRIDLRLRWYFLNDDVEDISVGQRVDEARFPSGHQRSCSR